MCRLWSSLRLLVWIVPLTLAVITFLRGSLSILVYMVLCVECEEHFLIIIMEIVIQSIEGLRVNKWTMWSEWTRVRPKVISGLSRICIS